MAHSEATITSQEDAWQSSWAQTWRGVGRLSCLQMACSQTTIVSQKQARQIPSTALVKGAPLGRTRPLRVARWEATIVNQEQARQTSSAQPWVGGRLEGGPGPPVHAPCHVGPRLLCGQLTSRVGAGGVEAWPARGLQRSPRNKNTRPRLPARTLLSFPRTGHNCNQTAGEGRPVPAWAPRAPPVHSGHVFLDVKHGQALVWVKQVSRTQGQLPGTVTILPPLLPRAQAGPASPQGVERGSWLPGIRPACSHNTWPGPWRFCQQLETRTQGSFP